MTRSSHGSIARSNHDPLTAQSTSAAPYSLCDQVIDYLGQHGVDYVFGIPGGAIEPLYNALARSARQGGPKPIVARHESGAAFMADGYARETGRLGVCCATTGPGSTNLITGVASAYADHVPMLILTAQTPLPTFGRGAFQESSCTGVDSVGMFKFCTRYSTLVSHAAQVLPKLHAATTAALQMSRPAHVSFPADVLRGPAVLDAPVFAVQAPFVLVDTAAVDRLFADLRTARRVVIIVGGGCADAAAAIMKFAHVLGADVVTTAASKGYVNARHPCFRGVLGIAGHRSARMALLDPDVNRVVAVGTALGEWESAGWDDATVLNHRLIHVDNDYENFARSPMARMHVAGDLRKIFKHLINAWTRLADDLAPLLNGVALATNEGPSGYPPPRVELDNEPVTRDDATPVKPQRLMRDMSLRFPYGTRFFADSTNALLWSLHYLHPRDRRRAMRGRGGNSVRTGVGFASMGWAIGAAVGAALGDRARPVVCITGDGSFLMSGQEITVAVAERLTVIFVILHDNALGTVKHGQRMAGAECVGFELPPIDFRLMARAMGARAHIIRSPADFAALNLDKICRRHGPTLLDVHIDPEEAPPLAARVRALNSTNNVGGFGGDHEAH